MSVNAIIHMVIMLWSIIVAVKVSKKEEVIPINRDLAFIFYVTIAVLLYEIPYNIAKTWLAPEWAFTVTIVILFLIKNTITKSLKET